MLAVLMAQIPINPRTNCYFGCEEGGPLHHFPKPDRDMERFDVWKEVLDDDTKEKGNTYIYNQLRICNRHFENYYKLPSNRLTRNAIPTLYTIKCALSPTPSVPVSGDSIPQNSNNEYESDNSAQASKAQEPAESASHYDLYIYDVKAAGSGDGKTGFSEASGLRTIAVVSANQTKTALFPNAQAPEILSRLEQEVREAKVDLQGEYMQLQQAKKAAQSAAQAAQQAVDRVKILQAALDTVQAAAENANEAASQAAKELGAQTIVVSDARKRLHILQKQLLGVSNEEANQAAATEAQVQLPGG